MTLDEYEQFLKPKILTLGDLKEGDKFVFLKHKQLGTYIVSHEKFKPFSAPPQGICVLNTKYGIYRWDYPHLEVKLVQ